ncbi:amidohydrolase family protein [Pseudomonas silvicola]|nr:amidohydrolase family protein [Pseudomonas silvicola]
MPNETGMDRRRLLKLTGVLGATMALPGISGAQNIPVGKHSDLLIKGATILTMDSSLGDISDGEVLIRNGVITAVGKNLDAAGGALLDARGMILIPGLIDTHWHLWNSFLRNSAPTAQGATFFKSQLASSPRFTPQLSALGVRLGLAEAAFAGITTVSNWSHNLRAPAFADAELRAMADSGLRTRLWYGYAQDLAATATMDFKDIQRVHAQIKAGPGNRLDLGVAVRGPERTGPPVWGDEFAFAKAQGLPVSTHIAVTPKTQQQKAVQQLVSKGVLDSSVQLVHATHVDAEDIRSIAASGASVCLTPLTEMRVGYGLAPVATLHQGKIPLSLGIDTLVLSGNANPFMVMQTLLNLGTGISENELTLNARDVLHWATLGAAQIMGLSAVTGSISIGKRADLVLIDTRRLGMFPVTDPLAAVVQSATPADVDTVIADGWILKQGGRLLRVDVQALAAEANEGWNQLKG